MPHSSSFRQVDEKHVSSEARLMCWSPKMDLLALSNVQGEVILHRLSWQKVWTLTPPTEGDVVVAMSWRPDGQVLGIAYMSGEIMLCDIEDATVLHKTKLTSSLSCMVWIDRLTEKTNTSGDMDENVFEAKIEEHIFSDSASNFLPRLPPFNKTYTPVAKGQSEENFEDMKKLKTQQELNILLVGTEDGYIHFFAYGIFPVGVVNLNNHGSGKSGQVKSAFLSHDLNILVLLVESVCEDGEYKRVLQMAFNTTLLASKHIEIRTLALKFGHIASLLSYLDCTVQQMKEAWEDILLEMDSKLAKFADEKRTIYGGSVSNDFLRLLMFGIPSDELQNFLLHDLTEKGLKKLGHSIETSYSNIQKLVLKHLQSVGQALVYHLSDVRGMAQWRHKFSTLGVRMETVQHALNMATSFMLKASHLQQVIDGSMKNFKAFFRRLYVVIQRLSGEHIPPELTKMTQQDINFVAQFLSENFTEEPGQGKSGFKLEKVGQYLKDEDIVDPPDNSDNPWIQFLQQTPKVEESELLYQAHSTKSLVQMHGMLISAIDDILHTCASVIGQSFHCVAVYNLYHIPCEGGEQNTTISHLSKEYEGVEYVYTLFTAEPAPCRVCYVVRLPTRVLGSPKAEIATFQVTSLGRSLDADESSSSDEQRCDKHSVLDAAFYDEHTLSLLLQEDTEDSAPVLCQLPIIALEEHFIDLHDQDCMGPLVQCELPCTDVGSHIEDMSSRRLENMRAVQFAVSGTRKVTCVLFASRRRVRLFMMDADDDDEDDDTTYVNNSALDDVSIHRPADVSRDISRDLDGDEDKENSRGTTRSNVSAINV